MSLLKSEMESGTLSSSVTVEVSASVTSAPSGLRVVNREVRGRGHVQFPWKLIDGPPEPALLISALLDHQLDVFIIQDTDEVTLGVPVV